MVTFTPTFAQPSENYSSWHLGHQTCNSPSNNHPHKSSTLREQARSETVDTMSQRHATLLSSSSLARNGSKKVLLELVGRSDSDWAGDSATRQSFTGYHFDVQNVTMYNRSLKQTAISLSSCEAEFYAASACARELLGLAELFKETSLQRFSLSRDGFRLGKAHSTAQRTKRTQTCRNTMPRNITVDTRETFVGESSGHEEQHCRSLLETS